MLIEIRDRATGIVAYLIVGLLVVSFALWGIQEYFGASANPPVAKVDGLEISKREFDSRLQEQSRYLRSVLGRSFDLLYEDQDVLKNQVLDGLVQNAVLQQATMDAGYLVSDNAVLEALRSMPSFQTNGQFDVKRYEQLLSAQRLSTDGFEQRIREEQSVRLFEGSVAVSSFLTDLDKNRYGLLSKQKRDFSYLILPLQLDSFKATDDEIQSYYEKNIEQFREPAKAKLEYIEIDQASIASEFSVSEENLKLEYDSNPSRFRSDPLRNARRILLKADAQDSEENIQQKMDTLTDLSKRIHAGEDFAKLAREYSQDKTSAANGGELGFVSATEIDDPEFNQILFSLKPNEISPPVRTRFGVQIVQLLAIQPAEQQSFEQARGTIESELRQEFAQKEFFRRVEEMDHLTYEHDDNLTVAAEALELEVHHTGWVSPLSEEGIMANPKVREAAFSEELIQQGLNSSVIELDGPRAIVLRITEYREAKPRSLDEVRDMVGASVREDKARHANLERGNVYLQKLKQGDIRLEAIASDLKLTLQTPGPLLRDDAKVPADILQAVFQMPRPVESETTAGSLTLDSGDYVLIRLSGIVSLENGADSVEASEWVVQQTAYGRRELDAVTGALRDTAKIRLYPDNM